MQKYQCDFEKGLQDCSFLANAKNNEVNWKPGRGKLNAADTGPSVDHTIGNGKTLNIFYHKSCSNFITKRFKSIFFLFIQNLKYYCALLAISARYFYFGFQPFLPKKMQNCSYPLRQSIFMLTKNPSNSHLWPTHLIRIFINSKAFYLLIRKSNRRSEDYRQNTEHLL